MAKTAFGIHLYSNLFGEDKRCSVKITIKSALCDEIFIEKGCFLQKFYRLEKLTTIEGKNN
jgi:hypothetical protein